ncbi:glutathione S-transferase family protein [Dongia soli]|uniref:glutathione transferase n=1 Tax=Dongia soli TaxID=600628 RepID=A0ABU5E6P4_9PROT|nr:glutathione S-transferase family protein [Dongia soli]MDY0881704.1 glutathione S-transferase family protein [Dongia soli]
MFPPSDLPIVYGAAYSVYVCAVRLALEEKGVAYELVEVDVFAPGGVPSDHLRRHPFGRIPSFRHGAFELYESGAIERYIDEAFAGPTLQPAAPQARARLNQITGLLDNYAYRTLVWDIYVERVSAPKEGRVSDEARLQAALPRAARCLGAIEDLMESDHWLVGTALSLADLHAVPMIGYFVQASEGRDLLAQHPRLTTWWEGMQGHSSVERLKLG